MEKILTWKDKSDNKLIIKYDGNKTGNAVFLSDVNEGLDRAISVTFKSKAGHSIQKNVILEGRREVFNAYDGLFLLSDCDTFNVIKKGYEL